MQDDTRLGGAVLAAALMVTGALYLAPLAIDLPLLDPDEGLHAAIAQEMVERGDWVTPRLFGEAFLDKPILFFWAQAASLSLGGMNETAVRLPGLLFGLLGSLTTGLLGWRVGGPRCGALALVLHGTMVLPIALAQAAVHDVALVPWINLALLAWWQGLEARDSHRFWSQAIWAGLWLGLAILTKGLVGVVLAGLAYAGLVLCERRLAPRIVLGLIVSGLTALVVAAPWYLLMEQRNPGYLYYYFVERHLLGYVTHSQRHGGRPWWYYLPLWVGGGIPWALYVPVLLREQWLALRGAGVSSKTATPSPAVRLAGCWLVLGLAFLSLASSKLVTYLLPLFPPTAMLAADLWNRWMCGRLHPTLAWGMRRVLLAECLLGPVVLPCVLLVAGRNLGATFSPTAWLAAGVVSLVAWAPLVTWWRQQVPQSLCLVIGSLALIFAVTMSTIMPDLGPALSSREVARQINARSKFPDQLLIVEERFGSLVFYLDPRLRRDVDASRLRSITWYELQTLPRQSDDAWILLPNKRLPRAAEHLDLSAPGWDRLGHFRRYSGPAALAARLHPQSAPVLEIGARPR